MDRISVILLCITTLCIFWIINKKEETVNVESYLKKIEMLEKKVDSLHTKNELLDKQADSLEIKVVEYDKKIRNLNYSINVIKKETNEKLNAVDMFGDDELERFFAERYAQQKDSVN
jgi:uncharacterized protein YoxC|tara:strand:+ start:836 stop:1186 length:351 start_codon:yes stop_codon:yes gene_type:complete